MALDYQMAMYSKCGMKSTQSKNNRTSYERMNNWRDVVTSQNPESHVDDLLERQNYPSHLNYTNTTGYDDNHKSFLRLQQDAGMRHGFPNYGPPRLRNGKTGGSWRHIKEVLQAQGSRRVFIDGRPGLADMTLVRGQEIPAGNTIHKMARPSKPLSRNTFIAKQTEPKQMASYELGAFKGTEHDNWMIMR